MTPLAMRSFVGVQPRHDCDSQLSWLWDAEEMRFADNGRLHHHPEVDYFLRKERSRKRMQAFIAQQKRSQFVGEALWRFSCWVGRQFRQFKKIAASLF